MKRTTMQKTIAMLTAAITAVTLTGCGGDKSKLGSTLEVSFDNAFSSQEVKGPEFSVSKLIPIGEQILMLGYDKDYAAKVALYDPASSTTTAAEMKYMKNASDERMIDIMGAYGSKDGGCEILYYDYTMNEDWEIESQCYYIESYDSSMKLVDSRDVTENIGDDSSFYNVIADKSGNIYAMSNTMDGMQYISVRDENFKEKGIVEVEAEWLDQLFCSANGTVYVSGYSNMGGMLFGSIDPETFVLNEVDVEGMPEYYNGTLAGADDYDFFVYDSTSVKGINAEKGICEEVLNWMNSDFSGDYVSSVAALPGNRFLTSMYDENYESSTLWQMEERSEEELKNMEVISLSALYTSSDLVNAVGKFNRGSDKLRIVIKDYSAEVTDEEDSWNAAMDLFSKDMTSGKVADIICTEGLNFESYANKGVFVDLYTLMENDESFNKDDYFQNYFTSLEYKEKLMRMGFSFNINTLAAKTEYVGDKSGITPAEFMEIIKNTPDGMDVFPNMTRSTLLYSMMAGNIGTFVDTVNATCNFNTPEFIELLELCSTYPADDHLDYNSMDNTDWEQYWEAEELAYRNDTALFKNAYIEEPRRIHELLEGDFGGEEVTLVGFPTTAEGSSGGVFQTDYTIAISSQSKYQEEIWEFFKYMLSEEHQNSLEWNFPVNKKSYEQMVKETLEDKEEYNKFYYLGNEEFDIGFPMQEEMDKLTEYIGSITQSSFYDDSVMEIIDEETQMYFAGDQDAKQTAEMIQSRVGLYLSEQS